MKDEANLSVHLVSMPYDFVPKGGFFSIPVGVLISFILWLYIELLYYNTSVINVGLTIPISLLNISVDV